MGHGCLYFFVVVVDILTMLASVINRVRLALSSFSISATIDTFAEIVTSFAPYLALVLLLYGNLVV